MGIDSMYRRKKILKKSVLAQGIPRLELIATR